MTRTLVLALAIAQAAIGPTKVGPYESPQNGLGDGARGITSELRAVLLRDFRFTEFDLSELEHGRIIKRALGSGSPGEIAVAGATRVNTPKEILVERFRDITHFKSGSEVLQIGRFSSPPALGDLAPLTIDKADFDGRSCRVGDCDVRLPAGSIQRFQKEIVWTASDADVRAAALFKQMIFDNVRAYLAGTPDRFTQYDDDKRPVRPVDEFTGLLRNFSAIGALAPELPAYLEHFPSVPLAGGEDFLYWSKEKVAGMPFITITHVTIARGAAGSIVIASKDVYSSRYFDSSLGITVASDAVGAPGAFYLVYANRARAAALKGMLGGLRRALVERRAKSSLDENLKDVKARLERGS
jgi:hypothetical protein